MTRIASKATKGKGKRWLKGHSSTSNPESKKHRVKATQALLGGGGGSSGDAISKIPGSNNFSLTKDLLQKFDAIQLQKQRLSNVDNGNLSEDGGVSSWLNNQSGKLSSDSSNASLTNQLLHEDAISLGNVSAASIWSNCTNVSFDRFLNGFDAKSKMHKSMLTVLATIREAIGKANGTESETEYFAALMVTLNCVDSEEKLTATLALIQIILKRVPPAVLKLKFTETSNAFLKILNERINSHSQNGYLLKSIISALSTMLQSQNRPIWELSSTQKVFQTLLSLILHIKPRVRKAAIFAIISIVTTETGDSKNSGIIVARQLLADFCISKLEEHLTTTQDEHLHIFLYILSLLSETLFLFPSVQHTKRAVEAILSHMILGNVLVVNGALHTFYSFFLRRPKASVLSAEMNAKLMNALYGYQPNINDEQPLNAWCIALKECLLSLHNLDSNLSQIHLIEFIKSSLACFQSDSSKVHSCVCNSIKTVFATVVQEDLQFPSDLLAKLYTELELSLKYQYSHAWIQVMQMLSELFIDNDAALKSQASIVQRLAILHDSNDSEVNNAIDAYFAKAVEFYGPQAIVKLCPIYWRTSEPGAALSRQDSEFRGEFTNPWLLSILRDHTKNKAHLGLFIDHFMPLADDILKRSTACKKLADQLRQALSNQMETDSDDVAFRAHESCLVAYRELKRCVHALWALLPAFCHNPVDIPEVIGKIARRLGETLYDRELYTYALAALRNLLKCSNEVIDKVAPFAKNYLPILFNIYTNENENTQIEEGMRLPVLLLVQHFVPHLFVNDTSAQIFRALFDNITKRLVEPNCSDFRKKALYDLLGALLISPKGFEVAEIDKIYLELAKPLILKGATPADKKKGFLIIEKIISSPSPVCGEYVRQNLENLLVFLYSCISNSENFTSPSIRAFALRTIRLIIDRYLGDSDAPKIEWIQFFEKLLTSILDTLMTNSVKAHKVAQNTLLTLANSYAHLDWTTEDSGLITHKLINQIIDPLRQVNSCNLPLAERTARLSAITFLFMHKYNGASADLQCDIADVVLSQISPSSPTPPNRQILKICFEFITVFFKYATPDMLNSYLEMITCSITNLPQEHRTKYRTLIRNLLTKLVRKYGFDFIASMVSEDYSKVLKNIKKSEISKKKKKLEGNSEHEDSESDAELDKKSRRSHKSRNRFADSDEDEAEVEQFIDDEWANDEEDDERKTVNRGKTNLDIMSRLSTKKIKSHIREDVEGDPFDLLSPHAGKNVFSKIPKKFQKTEDDLADQQAQSKKLPISGDGRIVISDLLDQIESKEGSGRRAPKRAREEPEEEDNSEVDDEDDKTVGKTQYKPGGRGIHRAVSVSGETTKSNRTSKSKASNKSSKGKHRNEPQVNRGEAYRSKTAAGDMKRRGMPDPYAFIPLNPIALNKRKSLKYKGEFKSIIKGAQKGATMGAKSKKRMKKNM